MSVHMSLFVVFYGVYGIDLEASYCIVTLIRTFQPLAL